MNAQRGRPVALGLAVVLVCAAGAWARQQQQLDAWPYLLRYPEVRTELKLSEAQKGRLDRVFESADSAKPPTPELARRITEILDAAQSRRLGEIRYHVLLTRGALPEELITMLGLSAEQKKALTEVLAGNQKRNAELLRRLATENLRVPAAREKLKKLYYDPARQRVLAALPPEKRELLMRLIGKDFPAAFELAESF